MDDPKLEDSSGHLHQRQTHELIERSRREAPAFNFAWLKSGEKLNPTQRVGFGAFSLVFIGYGMMLLDSARVEFHDRSGDPTYFCFGIGFSAASLFMLYFGVLGLRNTLRFKPRNSSRQSIDIK